MPGTLRAKRSALPTRLRTHDCSLRPLDARGVSPSGSSQASPPPPQGPPPRGHGPLSTSASPSSRCRAMGSPGRTVGEGGPSPRGSAGSCSQPSVWPGSRERSWRPPGSGWTGQGWHSGLQTWVAPRGPLETVQGRRVGVWGDLGRRLEAGGWAQAAVGRVLRRGLWGAWLALPVPLQPIPPHHAVAGPEGPPRGRSEGVLGHLAGWEAAPGPRLLPRHHATRGGGLSEPLWLQRPCPPGARLPEPPGWLRCRRGLPGRWGQTWALTRALCPLPGSRGVSGAPAAPGPCGRAREGPWPHWSEPEPTAVGSLALVGGLGAGTCQGAPPWRPVPSR